VSVAVALVVGALLAATATPAVLNSSRMHRVAPGVGLSMWLSSMLSVGIFALASVVIAAWPQHAPFGGLVGAALGCVALVAHTVTSWADELIAVAAVVVVAWCVVRAAWVTRGQLSDAGRGAAQHTDVLRLVATHDATVGAVWLEHPTPMAYSVQGRPGIVVATTGLRSSLSPREVAAVLAHERAHLAGRHHRIVALTAALARALPAVPLFARAPAEVRTLVELCADRAAMRATDPTTVRSALSKVVSASTLDSAGLAPPAGALGVAATALQLRLAHLDQKVPPRGRGSLLAYATATVLTVALPVLAGGGGVAAVMSLCAVL